MRAALDHDVESDGDRSLGHEKFLVLLIASLVSSLIMLDSNIVAVSLPAIGRSLSASFTDIQWVISAYVLTYAALLLATGSYADLHGRRQAMLVGLVVFASASAACGIAANSLAQNLARGVQGVGGAFLLTASLAIISAEFTGEARARRRVLRREPRDCFGRRPDHRRRHHQYLRLALDLPGQRTGLRAPGRGNTACSCRIARSRRQAAGYHGHRDVQSWPWPVDLGPHRRQRRWLDIRRHFAPPDRRRRIVCRPLSLSSCGSRAPMVDFALFQSRTFVGAVLAMIGYGASAQVMVFFLPLLLQNAYGYAPLVAGIAMLPFAAPMVLARRLTSSLADRFSGRRASDFGSGASPARWQSPVLGSCLGTTPPTASS